MPTKHLVYEDTSQGLTAHIANYTVNLWHGGGLWGAEIMNNITGRLVNMYDHRSRTVVESWVNEELRSMGVVS